jgi:hypothetical protein
VKLLLCLAALSAAGCESLAARRTIKVEVSFVTATPILSQTHVVFHTEK